MGDVNAALVTAQKVPLRQGVVNTLRWAIASGAAGNSDVELNRRGDGGTVQLRMVLGDNFRIDPAIYESVSLIDGPAGSVELLIGIETGDAQLGNQSVALIGSTNRVDPSFRTLVEKEAFAGTLAAPTAETNENVGTTTIPVGARVAYNLAYSGSPVATANGDYVGLRGATSNTLYAIAMSGQAVAGTFDMPTAEKLNIVAANADAATTHLAAAYWQAMTS